MNWKPIKTAPKNRQILVSGKDTGGYKHTFIAIYVDRFTFDVSREDDDGDYCEDDDEYYLMAGWYEWSFLAEKPTARFGEQPTHWMELPAPAGYRGF